MTKLLIVTGKTFCAGAIFEKKGDKWVIISVAPYLRQILGRTPISEVGKLLKKKGFKYEWH